MNLHSVIQGRKKHQTVNAYGRFRRRNYGKFPIHEMERRAKAVGVNTIRLEVFRLQRGRLL